LSEEAATQTVRIDVPLKSDRTAAEARRRNLLAKLIYASGGALIIALILFVVYKSAYP
jgi:hypothetical protein